MINDIYGFNNIQSLQAVQGYNCKLCVMHMQGTPQSMQLNPNYEDVLNTIHDFFIQKLNQMQTQSIDINRIILDVGFGFGKSMSHNIALLKNLQSFKQHNQLKQLPMLVGVSNKRFIGYMTAQDTDYRMLGNAMAHLTALQQGADIIRVHNVAQAMQVKRFYQHLHNFVVDG
jgi:dihydropteroate synthase